MRGKIITSDSYAGEDHIHACNRANTSMDALIGSCTLLVSGDIVEVILCRISRQRKEGKQNVFASNQQCVNCQWLLSACVRESCGSADQHRAHEAKCNTKPTAQKRTHTHLKSFDPGKLSFDKPTCHPRRKAHRSTKNSEAHRHTPQEL